MSYWNRVKIKFQQEQENGTFKTLTEEYLLKAVSFTDAETRIFEIVSKDTSDFTIQSVVKARYSDVFDDGESEKWFEGKIVYMSLDEIRGTEKRIVNNMLVKADTIDKALITIRENLKTMLIPYEIEAMKLTTILEVYNDNPYKEALTGDDSE